MKFEKVNVGEVKVGDKAILNKEREVKLTTVSKVDNPKLGNTIGFKDSDGVFYVYLDSAFVYRVIEKEVCQVHWFDLKAGDTLESTDDNMMLLKVASLGHDSLTYKDYGSERKISLRDLKDNGYAGSDLKFNVIRKVSYDIQTRID